jgi:hypothetical protein
MRNSGSDSDVCKIGEQIAAMAGEKDNIATGYRLDDVW